MTEPTLKNGTDKLAEALAKAQGEMKNAPLNKVNPHFKSKYADLAAIRDATIPTLSKNGLAIIQYTKLVNDNNKLVLVTRLAHITGQYIESEYPLPVNVEKPQAMGSAFTYAKRYSWAAMVGISADEDDDANAAQSSGVSPHEPDAPKEKTTKDADWVGPLNKTALKQQLRELISHVMGTTDALELDGYLNDYKEVVEQAQQDLPEWITGDGGDKHGLDGAVEMMRSQFSTEVEYDKLREAG